MKGERKKRAEETSGRKQRLVITIVLIAVIVMIVALFLANQGKPLISKPARFGF